MKVVRFPPVILFPYRVQKSTQSSRCKDNTGIINSKFWTNVHLHECHCYWCNLDVKGGGANEPCNETSNTKTFSCKYTHINTPAREQTKVHFNSINSSKSRESYEVPVTPNVTCGASGDDRPQLAIGNISRLSLHKLRILS